MYIIFFKLSVDKELEMVTLNSCTEWHLLFILRIASGKNLNIKYIIEY